MNCDKDESLRVIEKNLLARLDPYAEFNSRWHAANSAHATEKVLLKAVEDRDYNVVRSAVMNPHTTEKVLLKALSHNNNELCYWIVSSPKATAKVVKEFLLHHYNNNGFLAALHYIDNNKDNIKWSNSVWLRIIANDNISPSQWDCFDRVIPQRIKDLPTYKSLCLMVKMSINERMTRLKRKRDLKHQ